MSHRRPGDCSLLFVDRSRGQREDSMSRHGTRPLSRLAVLSLILFASGLPAAAQDVGVTGDSIKIGIFGRKTTSAIPPRAWRR
jgi:hypothetical protein